MITHFNGNFQQCFWRKNHKNTLKCNIQKNIFNSQTENRKQITANSYWNIGFNLYKEPTWKYTKTLKYKEFGKELKHPFIELKLSIKHLPKKFPYNFWKVETFCRNICCKTTAKVERKNLILWLFALFAKLNTISPSSCTTLSFDTN